MYLTLVTEPATLQTREAACAAPVYVFGQLFTEHDGVALVILKLPGFNPPVSA